MRLFSKRRIIVLLVIILEILSIARIAYVNLEQHVTKAHMYKSGEKFEYNDFQIEVTETDFYSSDNIEEVYGELPEDALVEKEIIIKLKVKNIANEEQILDISSFVLQVGLESGGSVDPYLFPYLNPGLNGSFTLKKGESQTVLLAFPIDSATEKDKEDIKLILSLYPEKNAIEL